MSRTPRIEFLERSSYRQRRMRDAARVLPIVAAVLMVLPLMWPRDTPDQSLTSSGILYLFGLWFVLILFAFSLSRVLRLTDQPADKSAARRDPDTRSEP